MFRLALRNGLKNQFKELAHFGKKMSSFDLQSFVPKNTLHSNTGTFISKERLQSPFTISRVYNSTLTKESTLIDNCSSTENSTTNNQPVTEAPSPDQGRILIGFTCKICETRTHRTMGRLAYTKGVVLVECPGCQNRHLIADNLGWFDQPKGVKNIKDILSQKGERVIEAQWKHDKEGRILEIADSSIPLIK